MTSLSVKALNKLIKWRERSFRRHYDAEIRKHPLTYLCFHDVGDPAESPYTISREDFLRVIERIGDKVVTLDEGCQCLEHERRFVLTFDDGYESVYRVVYPMCKTFGIPFTVFVATDLINQPGYLTHDQIAELARNDNICTIGSHMCSHRRTREMSLHEAQVEWERSKLALEEISGRTVAHGALPYGSVVACSLGSVRACFRSGYETLSTTLDIPVRKGKVLPRRVYKNNTEFVF